MGAPFDAELDAPGAHGGRRAQRALSDLLVEVLLSGRDSGLFDKLPRTDTCLMTVQDDDEFSWPSEAQFGVVNQLPLSR